MRWDNTRDHVCQCWRTRPHRHSAKVADGFDPGAVIGPLINMKAVEKVEARMEGSGQRGSSRNVVGRTSARTIDWA